MSRLFGRAAVVAAWRVIRAYKGIVLSPQQADAMFLALGDAMDFNTGKLLGWRACDAAELACNPLAACGQHYAFAEQADRYSALGKELTGGEFGVEVTPRRALCLVPGSAQ